ncbi:MAG: hypothetical protein VSS52_010985 [Thiotrichaceae bacterium]|nr:hypothetical protein [Thiotrichaceae bacterium]
MMPPIVSAGIGGQALKGVDDCKAMGTDCWNPMEGFGSASDPSIWDIFMPLGLPLANQKMVMLLHYPPYVSLEEGDYLNNNTMRRWERMLQSVGVAENDISLYESIVDVNPIAAPGSGQSAYLPTLMASAFFDNATNDRQYISPMLVHMSNPPANEANSRTLPVIIFGSEAIEYWKVKYKDNFPVDSKNYPIFSVLDYGDLTINGSDKETPYMGANHPIAAVYQDCSSDPGIITIEKQDLTTACFTRTLGEEPQTATDVAFNACNETWMTDTPAQDQDAVICTNAIIDMSYFNSCSWEQASEWCAENSNQVCGATLPECINDDKDKK